MKVPLTTSRPKQVSEDVMAAGYDDADVRSLPTTADYVSRSTWRSTVGDWSAFSGRDQSGAVLNPLHVIVPAACVSVLLSFAVLWVLLVRYGRQRNSDDDRRKCSALLPPSVSAFASSPVLPAPRQPAVELSHTHESRVCLHCNRPIFIPTSAAYMPIETRS